MYQSDREPSGFIRHCSSFVALLTEEIWPKDTRRRLGCFLGVVRIASRLIGTRCARKASAMNDVRQLDGMIALNSPSSASNLFTAVNRSR